MSEKEEDDSFDSLSKSLETTAEELDSLLRQARRHVQESLESFIQKEIWSLAAAIGHYFKLFQSYSVISRDELENRVRKHYREPSIRESYEELLDIEREWNSFLKDVEDKAKTKSASDMGPLQEGQCLPLDMALYHLTKEKKIDDLNGAVVVVSFTSKQRTLQWKGITNCTYEILLDQERKLYKAVGLHPSVAKAWHTDMMNFYGGKKAAGETLPPPDAHEDTKQMGGDLIADCSGILHLVYCSKTSKDRPNISLILDVLQKIKDLQPNNESEVK